jgi:hypothetical protein
MFKKTQNIAFKPTAAAAAAAANPKTLSKSKPSLSADKKSFEDIEAFSRVCGFFNLIRAALPLFGYATLYSSLKLM